MKVLVTGSGGSVGYRLMPMLREAGFDTVGLDSKAFGDDSLRVDIAYFGDLYDVFRSEKPDMVVHMAGEVGRMMGELHPARLMETNIIGVVNLARICAEKGVPLVNFSTSEVYGVKHFNADERVAEDQPLVAADVSNIYALSKLTGEAVVKHYVENYNLKATTVRPFMLYGPGESPSKYRSAMGNFIRDALAGRELTVHRSTGRSWCYVDDFVRGLILVMRHPMAGYEAWNIGSDEYMTMLEAAQTVIRVLASKSSIVQVDPPSAFSSPIKKASIEKIRSIGYRPEVTLAEGVKRVAVWQRENR